MSLGETIDAVRWKHYRAAHHGATVVGCETCEDHERIQDAYAEMIRGLSNNVPDFVDRHRLKELSEENEDLRGQINRLKAERVSAVVQREFDNRQGFEDAKQITRPARYQEVLNTVNAPTLSPAKDDSYESVLVRDPDFEKEEAA